MAPSPKTAPGRTGRNLQLLTTYEQCIRRSVEKNMAELKTLQAGRKAAVEQAETEARLLLQLAEYEGRNFDPANDLRPESQPLGFVFSKPAIQRPIERDHRLGRARHLDFHGYFQPSEPKDENAGL